MKLPIGKRKAVVIALITAALSALCPQAVDTIAAAVSVLTQSNQSAHRG